MKMKLALTFLLAGSICLAMSGFAQTLSVSPNPVCVGKTITVNLTGVCGDAGSSEAIMHKSVQIGDVDINVSLTNNGGGNWSGTYTTTTADAGTHTVTASDDGSCTDNFNSVSLTVVKLDDITFVSDPAGSGWHQPYSDANRDYAALKSPTNGAVVTFGLKITPNNATAASLVTWHNATASSDKTTATIPATAVLGPQSVTASDDVCTTPPYTVWIFWGTITYNFSGPFDASDHLSFDFNHFPYPTSAGSVVGLYNLPTLGYYLLALNKVEIIGTLKPSGICNLVGNIFSFDPQGIVVENWSNNGAPLSSVANTDQGANSDTNEIFISQCKQLAAINDKIFEIDSPGTCLSAGGLPTGYLGDAFNATDYIYIGSVKASDAGYWHSFCKSSIDYYPNIPSYGISCFAMRC